MAYATGYEYDIFISYARADDIGPAIGDGEGWVSEFKSGLERSLPRYLGGQMPRIYFDRRDLHGNHELDALLAAVRSSALFLAVASPTYAARPWTRRELATFAEGDAGGRRLFAVECLPLDEGETYPAPLDSRNRLKFWESGDGHTQLPRTLREKDRLFDKIGDLAAHMGRQLKAINQAEAVRPEIGRAADMIADDAARRAKGVVYLAEVTDDLEEQRLQVHRYLEQYEFLVLPPDDLPGGGEAFKAAAEAAIRQSDLYVHLLGRFPGKSPADLPEGYGAAQVNAARTSGRPMLLWRHPELDVDSVADPRQKALLSDQHVIASGLEQLKEEARRRLAARAVPARTASPRSLAFISTTKDDYEVAKLVQQEFAARDMPVAVSLLNGTPGETDDLMENMRDCDVMVFIYGEAPVTWVRSQMRLFAKVRPTKGADAGPSPYVPAVLEGPPEKQQAELGFSLPGLRHSRFPEGWSAERIRAAITEMLA